MHSQGIKSEIRWFIFVVAAGCLVGFIVDALFVVLSIALAGFVLHLLLRLNALESWVSQARHKGPSPDDFGGVWGEIADDVRLLCKRYEKDKVRLQAVVSRIQEMTSALSDAVILVDSRGNIEWWNSSAHYFFAFRDTDRGHSILNYLRHPRFVNYFESKDYEKPLELDSMRKEGQHLQFHIHPFGHGERLAVVRDVTRVKRLEHMRKDFVSNVSHELRTPLTVIKGYIETLIDSPGVKAPWLSALQQMNQQSDRMTALVNDLIMLSSLETDEMESSAIAVALHPLLQSIISDAKSLAGDTLRFALTGDTQVSILGNERELRSAISNLTFNAVKYSPKGGDIEINVALEQQQCFIHVKDTGLGIDSKHIPRITERFYRVDEGRATSLGGTGLGLAIVKHALMRHDAHLEISSRLGSGSTFSCCFPIERVVGQRVAS